MMTVNDILSMMNRGEEIPVTPLAAACRGDHVARADLERRIREAGYFYAIAFDAFMPPGWIAAQRAKAAK